MISLEWLGLVSGGDYSPRDHLLSLAYIMFLVILVSILSVKYKHIRDNYHEAYSIYILMVFTVPLWIAWVSCSLLLPSVYTNAAFGIVSFHQFDDNEDDVDLRLRDPRELRAHLPADVPPPGQADGRHGQGRAVRRL